MSPVPLFVLIHSCSNSGDVSVCLGFALVMFGLLKLCDYTVYVLNPITRMVNLLDDIVENPSEAISKHESRKNAKKQNTSSTMELELIEKTIGKFGSLLKVAFGEAGKYKIYYFSNFFKFFDFKFKNSLLFS